jgi:hypothetical protein
MPSNCSTVDEFKAFEPDFCGSRSGPLKPLPLSNALLGTRQLELSPKIVDQFDRIPWLAKE